MGKKLDNQGNINTGLLLGCAISYMTCKHNSLFW